MITSHSRLIDFIHLTRFHKPVGAVLLLWPALWGLWLAAEGIPDLDILAIFIAGGFVMRAAGCAINDYADRHIDAHVERTSYRPVANGKIAPWEALAVFIVLSLMGLGLVLMTNLLTVQLACAGALIIAAYPFMKRYTHLPQLVLGLAWSWSLPMAFAAQANHVPLAVIPLMLAVICWTIVFDTFYAMVDRDDDLRLGVKSTAILFGQKDLLIIALFQLATLLLIVLTGWLFQRGAAYYLGAAIIAGLFMQELISTRHRDKQACFAAFMHNRWVGITLFVALVVDYYLLT
jgi:4-hydroxybenzoate polyprenyltransferase